MATIIKGSGPNPIIRGVGPNFLTKGDGAEILIKGQSGGYSTMLDQSIADGADHIFDWDGWTDKGASPNSSPQSSGASFVASTVPGCPYALRFGTTTSYGRFVMGAEAGWARDTNDRTWESVYMVPSVTRYRGLWGVNGAFAMYLPNAYIHYLTDGSITAVNQLTSIPELGSSATPPDTSGLLVYAAVTWAYNASVPANSELSLKFSVAGYAGAIVSYGPYLLSPVAQLTGSYATIGYVNVGGSWSSSNVGQDCYHFAVYPHVLTDGDITARLTILGLT